MKAPIQSIFDVNRRPRKTVRAFAAFLSLASFPFSAQATPVIGTPASSAVQSGTFQVTTTCQITLGPGDPAVSPGGVNLLRVDGGGQSFVGIMHDDGLNGDAVAGDGIFTLTFQRGDVGSIQLQVSVGFEGIVRRLKSATGTIQIVGPAIVQVLPSVGLRGQQNLSVSITGQNTHFVQGTTTASFGAGVMVGALTVNSSTSATAVLNIDAAAAGGNRNVTLTTGSEAPTLANGFAVTVPTPPQPPQPRLIQAVPNTGQQGQQNLSVVITGENTHFVQGITTAEFSGVGIIVVSVTVNSPTSATLVLNIDSAIHPGTPLLVLRTGTEIASLVGFTVTAGTPVLTQVVPYMGRQGQQNVSVAVTGKFTHFVQGATTASFGAGVTVNSVTVNSPTSATVFLNIDLTSEPGVRNVTLTTGSEAATLANAFTVTAQ
jgi:hypothetical protein